MMTKRLGASLLALALAAAHFASFDVVTRPIVTDVRFFLYYAWRVAEGAVPHLDFFENKPQLSTFVGALLFQIGDFAELDPLLAIRIGYLSIASAGGVLSFWIFRRLGRGSTTAGFLGLLAYCSFGLLGVMPAIGNVPKLLVAVLASVAALLAQDRRWFWAGFVGALAFMDWQIGAGGRPMASLPLSVLAGPAWAAPSRVRTAMAAPTASPASRPSSARTSTISCSPTAAM